MRSLIIVLPVCLGIAGFIVRLTTETLSVPVDVTTVLAAVAACTTLLLGRSYLSLVGIGGLIFLANANLAGYTSLQISHDTLLAVALTIILLPIGLRIAGVDSDLIGAI